MAADLTTNGLDSPNALASGKGEHLVFFGPRLVAHEPARRLNARRRYLRTPWRSARPTGRRAGLRVEPAWRLKAKQKTGFLSHG
jgi:hypothetical protein